MMTGACVMSIDELKACLASSTVLTFRGNSGEETYSWILRTYSYFSRTRSEKGLIRFYMQKMTVISVSQLIRRISQLSRIEVVKAMAETG